MRSSELLSLDCRGYGSWHCSWSRVVRPAHSYLHRILRKWHTRPPKGKAKIAGERWPHVDSKGHDAPPALPDEALSPGVSRISSRSRIAVSSRLYALLSASTPV